MGFFAAVKSVVWTNYLELKGRASRSEYWWFVLFYVLVLFATAIPDSIIFDVSIFSTDPVSSIDSLYLVFADPKQLAPLGFMLTILFYVPSITLTVRRLHDIGWSGHWAWPYFILSELSSLLSGGPLLTSLGLSALPESVTNSAGLVFLGLIVVLGLINSQIHDNQYGPVPPHKLPQMPQSPQSNEPSQPQLPPVEDAPNLNEGAAADSPETDSSGSRPS